MAEREELRNDLLQVLLDLARWLESERVPQATIGGIAVSLLAGSRTTQDVDAVIWLNTDTLERFLPSGVAFGFAPRIGDAAAFARKTRVILLRHQSTGIPVDLSCGALPFEQEMIDRARRLEMGGISIPVASPEDLIVTKAVAHRPQDLADIEAILEIETSLDLERIRYWTHQFAEALEMPELSSDLEKMLRRA